MVQTLVALPIVLPPTVIGFYLLVCFAPSHFPGSVWMSLTGRSLSFSFVGLVIGSVLYSLPYAVQPFQAALRGGAIGVAGGRRRYWRDAVANVLAGASAAGPPGVDGRRRR